MSELQLTDSVVGAAQRRHNLLGDFATAAVGVDVGLMVPLRVVVAQGFGGSQLYAAEGTAVDIALDFQNP